MAANSHLAWIKWLQKKSQVKKEARKRSVVEEVGESRLQDPDLGSNSPPVDKVEGRGNRKKERRNKRGGRVKGKRQKWRNKHENVN